MGPAACDAAELQCSPTMDAYVSLDLVIVCLHKEVKQCCEFVTYQTSIV